MIQVEQHGPVLCVRLARAVMGRPLYWTAAYWVEGLLIDTGPSCAAPQLLRMLERVYVDRIVVTHCHEDHIGGLALLHERFPDVPIYASRRAVATIQDPSRLHMPAYRRVIWGRPRRVAQVHSFDEVGDVVRTPSYMLRVVETPGHSADHACLYEPEQRWLFSGDAFIGGEERAWPREADLFGVLSSLRTLASLRPERLFPGSGTVRGGSLSTPLPAIHAKMTWLSQLAQDVAALDGKGATVSDMADQLLHGEPSLRFWTGGHFSAANLIEACRSYNALMRSPRAAASGRGSFESDLSATPSLPDVSDENRMDPPARRSTGRDDVLR